MLNLLSTLPHLPPRRSLEPPVLRFSPLAWLKLQYLCHAGSTEVGGFGISCSGDLLYVEQVETLMQGTTSVSVEFSDSAVADHFDRFADQQVSPSRCGRIWIHTHPGASAQPSTVDEETFARVFGPCDWALMFILSRTGQTYGRLQFGSGPGGSILVPVAVDWASWPHAVQQEGAFLAEHVKHWQHEYDSNVFNIRSMRPLSDRSSLLEDEQWPADEDWLQSDNGPFELHAELEQLQSDSSDDVFDYFADRSGWRQKEVSFGDRY